MTEQFAVLSALNIPHTDSAYWSDAQTRGELVAKLRNYASGNFDNSWLDGPKRRMGSFESDSPFGINYCRPIIQAKANRLNVEGFTLSRWDPSTMEPIQDENAEKFITRLMRVNRFDALQRRVHYAALRDGVTYVMADWDNDRGRVRWTHEPAYDGIEGVIAIYPSAVSSEMVAAVKVWVDIQDSIEVTRVNVYYPDRIEKYGGSDGAMLLEELPWTDGQGRPLGIPIISFINRPTSYSAGEGMSEIQDILALSDILNRTLYSMMVATELTAFRLFVSRGFDPPTALTPGMIIAIAADGMPTDQLADFDAIDPAPNSDYLSTVGYLRKTINEITSTPMHDDASGTASGESLKQREIGLLAAVQDMQVSIGNSWEDTIALSGRVNNAYGLVRLPEELEAETMWMDPQIRNEKEETEKILMSLGLLGHDVALQKLRGPLNLSDGDIQTIQDNREMDLERRIRVASAGMPPMETLFETETSV